MITALEAFALAIAIAGSTLVLTNALRESNVPELVGAAYLLLAVALS